MPKGGLKRWRRTELWDQVSVSLSVIDRGDFVAAVTRILQA